MVQGRSRVTVMEVTEGLNGNQPLEMGPENSGFPCPANLPLPACQILMAKKIHMMIRVHSLSRLVSIWTVKTKLF